MAKKRRAETIGIVELLTRFDTDQACREWLEQVRWNGEPICPHCGGIENITRPPSKPTQYWHKDCRKQFTVTTGTVMHSTRTPLRNWIVVIYSVLTARKGVSAMQLSKELGVQYRTAWYMLHRVREACQGGDFTLSNVCEVDETYVGGKEKNKHASKRRKEGRGTVGKAAVAGIRERDGKVVAQPMERITGNTMRSFVEQNIAPDATIYSDESAVYNNISDGTVKHSAGEYVDGDIHTNGIESVWSVFKRSIVGTWHHVSVKHLGRYVNEAAFRLNEGNCQIDTIDRMESLVSRIGGKRIKYQDLVS